MYSITQKISPSASSSQTLKKSICLCEALKPTIILCKLTGFFPLKTSHVNGQCVFEKSNFWLTYSVLGALLSAIQLISVTSLHDLFNIDTKSIHLVLSQINDLIYNSYIIVLHALCVIRYPRFISAFNNLTPILQEGLLCQSSLKSLRKVQYWSLCVLVVVFGVQYSALAWLQYSEKYFTDFHYFTLLNKFSQNLSFIFYMIFVSLCCVVIGILGCYENFVISCLGYKPVHPMENMDEINTKGNFMGLFHYTICDSLHPRYGKFKLMSSAELIEYLRYLHEEISQIMYEINTYLNPQMLCHTVVELTVLIINWYAVVIYLAYNFSNNMAMTLHFLNCIFVLFHTLGLFVFLKTAQHQNNIVKGISRFFIEYSTRVSSPEEHQQIRLFVDKIKIHKPLTANGIFTIDLGIAGPISANILTYVLVALQFNVPKS